MSTAKRYTTASDGVFDSVSGVTLDAGICGEEPVKRTRDGWDEPAPPSTLGPHFHRYGIVGHSRSIGEVVRRIELVSATRSTVLITGGTGPEAHPDLGVQM
jgi:hypothetical protein